MTSEEWDVKLRRHPKLSCAAMVAIVLGTLVALWFVDFGDMVVR